MATACNVVILDTGCANLASVRYALERLGCRPTVSRDARAVLAADKLLLPGVGNAAAAMEQLRQRDLIDLIRACTQPVLGICLGMQLLASRSAEGDVPCLRLVDTPVERMTDTGLPPPHTGWNQVTSLAGNPLFRGIPDGSYFYFVHSYAYPLCADTLAQCDYGYTFSAAVRRDNFYGVQFHPERSGKAGARLLKNFLEMPS
ncbi:imidazole glycerol phosphate synthase subunit HisH [Edwardsiella piscicida]|uniref:imidazole glycerol phosphate synthase subunit HisH n=1 Tax=Edwardsiella piscicida TaxID=1263550 RepID=UPI001CECC4F1|nr:imidazole glycerol phosphate synthase subunit HisH [Edwardsiella piscicida]AOP43487.2 imidazole glycerol phosphate synthase subunit HisH [Edwardsiella piscicida]UCQ30127.1 imidazole glycerol phosphate synthase subunit HisH [Edwardsiella piscicida]UCQ56400.1 imidazole glycerol phosphate synthase subunit HisH [Edwardsiella piscicida]